MFRIFAIILSAGMLLGTGGFAEEGTKNPVVVFETTMGTFEVELYKDKAPITVKNLLGYVNDKFYDGTIFHRVIDGFMIQGGGFTKDGSRKEVKAPIKNESGNGAKNVNYSIAMARTPKLDSATSQFFINVKDNAFLDQNQYCAFGMVIKGKDVIDKIKKVEVNKPGRLSKSQPKEPIVMTKVSVKGKEGK